MLFQGYKGMLAAWDQLPESYFAGKTRNRREVEFRASQRKFGTSVPNHLEICDWAKPHTYYTNRNTIMILSTLGVADD